MAYPFQKFPTFSEFFEKLRSERQILLKDLEQPVIKDASPLAIHYLERVVDGKTIKCVVDIQDFDARVSPSLMRSICVRLKLVPEEFGLATVTDDSAEEAIPPESTS